MQNPDEVNPAHPEFWDTFYETGEGSTGTYEWFMDWNGYKHLVEAIPKSPGMNVLHIGCGNSTFPERMKDGWKEPFNATILSVDICKNVIEDMKKNCGAKKKSAKTKKGKGSVSLQWQVMDCCKLDLPDESQEVVFDKGTVDALLSQCDEHTEAEGNSNVFLYFREVYRVLKPKGTFLLITINSPEVIFPYAMAADGGLDLNWSIDTSTIEKPHHSKDAIVHSHGGHNTAFTLIKE
eukprot:TRINITY_DN30253_c0_g1_i1.p1 TRINITY_DN30253_c0_g1~~TRINITY_DN30253_c0_g1_i1.p1  ORF type:complete len:255 (+),score=75.92 TRINITY_DN30253_c0_g1_i1:59-766(+)